MSSKNTEVNIISGNGASFALSAKKQYLIVAIPLEKMELAKESLSHRDDIRYHMNTLFDKLWEQKTNEYQV